MPIKKAVPLKIQAVLAKFESAREVLRAFEAEHARTVEEYTQLRGAYNACIEEVKEVYRDNYEIIGPTLGDFSIRTRIEVDGDALAKLMGGDRALQMGLIAYETKVIRKAYDRAVEEGRIPSDIISKVETQLPPAVVSPKKVE